MERDIKPTYDELESYVENLQKQLADAQATIAALQAQLKEMTESKVRCWNQWTFSEQEVKEQAETIANLQSQLTQRTAELEAATQHHEQSENAAQLYYRELTRAKNRICEAAGLPPDSGYEPAIKHLQAGLKRVREELADERTAYKALSEQYNRLDLEHDDLRTLLLALPKVEGEIVAKAGYLKDKDRVYALFASDEVMNAHLALWEHRQGMEG